MKPFNELPKSVVKTLRYINQDVKTMEKLEEIEKMIEYYIQRKKQQLEES